MDENEGIDYLIRFPQPNSKATLTRNLPTYKTILSSKPWHWQPATTTLFSCLRDYDKSSSTCRRWYNPIKDLTHCIAASFPSSVELITGRPYPRHRASFSFFSPITTKKTPQKPGSSRVFYYIFHSLPKVNELSIPLLFVLLACRLNVLGRMMHLLF